MSRKFVFILISLLLAPVSLLADTLVLVPGYLSDGHSWRAHGTAAALQAQGWRDGGNLTPAAAVPAAGLAERPGGKRFYTVELPSEAPLPLQLSYLAAYIERLRELHGDDRLLLAGHSAGGVLARYFMVTHPDAKVAALLTIASPHSGTDAAELGEFIGRSPLGWVTPMMGLATINRSQGLYQDLGRPDAASLLGWLNVQPHPPARYVSIVRPGDAWVAPQSQDMNHVPALAGRSQVLASPGDHGLNPADGVLLSRLLAGVAP